jgi:hypothetical protein
MKKKIQVFLISVLVGGESSASLPGWFTHKETAPPYPIGKRLRGPSAGLDDIERIEIVPYRNSNPDLSTL